ncbi:hypothetical protein L3X38_001189 [Prunus dulcis]|uniref:Uncharacterized protein n=1 Tax=Prunus dulcis TaxID=3755 RepID=A0AAD4WU21_PRUDU|nr:hypothetical protein L3X38_001189 [Prunus dulcis]
MAHFQIKDLDCAPSKVDVSNRSRIRKKPMILKLLLREHGCLASLLLGVNTLKIQPFKLPNLGPRDVLVRLKAVGICGSDVHHFKNMRCADFVVKEPIGVCWVRRGSWE